MKTPQGFIALMSAIIISAVLLLIASGGSLTGFYTRTNASLAELKAKTYAGSQGCVAHTLLVLSQNPLYSGQATTTLPTGITCYTGPVSKSGTPPTDVYTFKTRSYSNDVYTNMVVVSNVRDASVQSESEVSTF